MIVQLPSYFYVPYASWKKYSKNKRVLWSFLQKLQKLDWSIYTLSMQLFLISISCLIYKFLQKSAVSNSSSSHLHTHLHYGMLWQNAPPWWIVRWHSCTYQYSEITITSLDEVMCSKQFQPSFKCSKWKYKEKCFCSAHSMKCNM